ncbi:MAG: PAS domain S-box protein [Desulfosarcinaceae bacterium]|jgi:PAS domain S-box-containing protein
MATTADIENRRFLFENVFETIAYGIFVVDRRLSIVHANRWIRLKYDFARPLRGRKCHGVFHGREEACLECPCWPSISTGMTAPKIIPYPSDQKPEAWLELHMQRLEDRSGRHIGAIGHLKDISERKRSENLLMDEVVRRQLLVDQSRDGIVVIDERGQVFEANRKYAQMLGYPLEEVMKLHVWDWDAQWTKAQLLEMMALVDDSGDHFVTKHRRKDGSLYDVEISTNGTLVGGRKLIFCICRDITERKRAEAEKEQLIAELQAALKEIQTLREILPLCSYCKKIRNDKGYWEQVDVYIHKHLQADITHGICPECMQKRFPEEYESLMDEDV